MILLIIMLLFISVNINVDYVNKNYTIKTNDSLTMANIVQYMEEVELDQIPILLAQIHHETGNLSKVYNNNLFGFRSDKYIKFATWKDCVDYMKIWQDKYWLRYNSTGTRDYYAFLLYKKYAEDIDYIVRIKKLTKLYADVKN